MMGGVCVLAAFGSVGARRTLGALKHRSTRLDLQLLIGNQLLDALGALPTLFGSFWLATHVVFALDRVVRPELSAPGWLIGLAYSVVLFLAWDASRYVLHRITHEVPALWEFHQIHHSAEVLTPLSFHRAHPVELLLYRIRGVLVTGLVAGLFFWLFRGEAKMVELLGVHAGGFVLNALTGNLRHSHIWLSFGPLERWFISPAQHQIHHAEGVHANYGTWLAIWDRLGGSLVLSEEPPAVLGVAAADRNHGDDLLSAWLGPFVKLASAQRTESAGTGLPGSSR